MSDYISKSALVEALEKSMKENNHMSMIGYAEHIQEHNYLIHLVKKQPTLDETEIVRKAFERIIEILEQRADGSNDSILVYEHQQQYHDGKEDAFREAIEIVKEECGISE